MGSGNPCDRCNVGVTTWDPSSYAFREMTHATNAEAWKWKMQLGEREKGYWCHWCHHLLQFHDGSCSSLRWLKRSPVVDESLHVCQLFVWSFFHYRKHLWFLTVDEETPCFSTPIHAEPEVSRTILTSRPYPGQLANGFLWQVIFTFFFPGAVLVTSFYCFVYELIITKASWEAGWLLFVNEVRMGGVGGGIAWRCRKRK